jgi:hypothetical protein
VMRVTEAAATSSRRCAVFAVRKAVRGVELAADVCLVHVSVCSIVYLRAPNRLL